VAEGARLESVFTRKGNVGSNPTLSATFFNNLQALQSLLKRTGHWDISRGCGASRAELVNAPTHGMADFRLEPRVNASLTRISVQRVRPSQSHQSALQGARGPKH
jgi:hypothetical protein